MFGIFPISLIIQVYCIYHAYKNNAEQKWYWLIFFLPLIGCAIYLYLNVYNKSNVNQISSTIVDIANPNYKVRQLEKQVRFSGTVENKTKLADKYLQANNYAEAIELYTSCIEGSSYVDTHIYSQLTLAYYFAGNYESSLFYAEKIAQDVDFSESENKIYYAWSLYELGKYKEAETVFESMEDRYCNYPQRIAFCQFLKLMDRNEEALDKLEEMRSEYDQMDGYERRSKRKYNAQVYQLYKEVQANL